MVNGTPGNGASQLDHNITLNLLEHLIKEV